ncbi:hypothetical protein HPP92_004947 [Vanilla planifolia]|uniref:HMG box domain-containing protein n=1 Tax=Vanilla planifolia TaxID=51239 RepID=A0A835RM19_VANPL|nr:hypothetical protein HPP92_004947 [Vanilla planifolia]
MSSALQILSLRPRRQRSSRFSLWKPYMPARCFNGDASPLDVNTPKIGIANQPGATPSGSLVVRCQCLCLRCVYAFHFAFAFNVDHSLRLRLRFFFKRLFLAYREQFRKEFKEKNPKNKSVSVVGSAGGNKWKTMTESEKAPFVAKAKKFKDAKQGSGDEEASDKSKSEGEEDGGDELN